MEIIFTVFVAWALAQILKVAFSYYKWGKIDFKMLVSAGGMPSSHSSAVCSLTTKVGVVSGINSPLFAVCVVISLIVMYDAAGVRYAAGKQAEILNKIVEDFYEHKNPAGKLKELLGHTPRQVFAGMILGIIIGILV